MEQHDNRAYREANPSAAAGGGAPAAHSQLLAFIAVLATLWTLRAMPMVAIPLACALLVAMAVWPVSRAVRAAAPPRLGWLGSAAAMLAVAGVMAGFVLGLWLAGEQVVALARDIGPELDRTLRPTGLQSLLGSGQTMEAMLRQSGSSLLSAADAALKLAAGAVLVFFLILLMLTEAREWRDKLDSATGGGARWSEIAASVGAKFRIFFLTRLVLGSITALLYVAWLALFGIDYLLLWGLLTVLLNFIPTVGSIISGALPVALAVVQKDVGTAAVVAGGLLVIEQTMGNFVDPKVMGRQLSLSPLVVILSLLFWSWVWGPMGALLGAPLTVLVTIVLAHFEPLKPVALLFTRERSLEGLDDYRKAG